jgi:serpin B
MKRLLATLMTLGVFTMASLQGTAKDPAAQGSTDRDAVVRGNTGFGFDLYGRLASKDGNLFFSPYSISTALAMTYAGARSETAEQMARTLHFDLDAQRLHPAFAQLIQAVNGPDKDRPFQLYVANALWGQRGFDFQKAFLDLVRQDYGAGLREVDFKRATEEARQTINRWVEDQTNHKIRDLIGTGVLDADTRLVLTNAIYFKAAWASPFLERATKDEDFLVAADKKVRVPMMHQSESFPYYEGANFQMLELPYQGNQQSMVIVLPRPGTPLADVEKLLNEKNLNSWLSSLKGQHVQVALPRFKVTQEFELNRTLADMGMPLAFTDRADFSGMDGRQDLLISNVIHKAFVEVNEKGTEAAAATAVVMKRTSAVTRIIPFRADHPFVFAIRDRGTGSILFLGRVVNPQG